MGHLDLFFFLDAAMLLVRDLDALKAADLLSAPKSIELSQRELWWGNGVKAQVCCS